MLHLLWSKVLIKAYAVSSEPTDAWNAVCLAATDVNSTSTALGLS